MKKTLIAATLVTLTPLCVRADGTSTATQTDTTTTASAPTVSTPAVQPQYSSQAWNKRFGIGPIFGEPTGVSAKYWLNDTIALDASLGVGFYEETGFSTHTDVLWHLFDLASTSGRMPVYIGVGPRIKVEDDDAWLGARFPLGVSYMFDDKPMDIFFEVAPILDFTPDTRGAFSAAMGVRFWF